MRIKNKSRFLFLSLVFMACFSFIFPFSSMAAEDEVPIIDIHTPSLRKIPIATPNFVLSGSADSLKDIAKRGETYFADSIDFSGYFKVFSSKENPAFPKLKGLVASEVDFPMWKGEGMELLTTIGVSINAKGQLEMECRLFDVVQGSLMVGKRYQGPVTDYRKMILLFCSEILFQVTGRQGLYESRLAFVSNTTGHKEIYLCDYDGTGIRQETNDRSIVLSPAWSSDGNWLAYTSYVRGNPDLYIRNLSEGRGVLFSKPGVNITPAWLPGTFQLAATLSFEGRQNIYLITGHGQVLKNLTASWDIDVSPSFSGDGSQMAFVSSRTGSPQIYVMDMKTGKDRRVTFHGGYNTSPAFSPDGKQIAYVGSVAREGINIYLLDLETGNVIQLTRKSGDNEDPTWSPDGSLIAFSSTREGQAKIYVMTAYGTDQRRLLNMPGAQISPRWSLKPIPFK